MLRTAYYGAHPTMHFQWKWLRSFSFFVPGDLEFWPLTLTFEYGRDFCTMYLTAKFDHPTLSRSEVIVWTNTLTNKLTDKQTDAAEKHPSRFTNATLVGNYKYRTSGYATMVHSRGCNPHRCTTTFANVEITSLWRHWWRHNSETIRDRQKLRPPRAMKSTVLSNGENHIALWQLFQNRKLRHLWRHNLGSRWKLQKNDSREF